MTREEANEAKRIGAARTTYHIKRGTAQTFGEREDLTVEQKRDSLAALAEATVAEYLGLPWAASPCEPDNGVDVGDCVGVRHTTMKDGSLIIKPKDKDNTFHVLVVGWDWPMKVVGWAVTGHCKVPKWWRQNVPQPGWFVPQWMLFPPETLRQRFAKVGIRIPT